MTDILLTHGYFIGEDAKEQQIMKPYPPLGLLYLSASLKEVGLVPEVFDSTFRSRQDLYRKLKEDSHGVIGIYSTHVTRPSVVEIISVAKREGWTVILGGPDSANYPDAYLQRGADVIVIGEGERTLPSVLAALKEKGDQGLYGLAGTVFQDEQGTIVRNPSQELLPIEDIPWPDRESIDLEEYFHVWSEHHGLTSLNVNTARGCPYSCRWCSHAVFGYSHRQRSAHDCADEVALLHDKYEPDQLWYVDDVFTMNHPWLFQYAEELKQRNIKIPFETISRADRLMSVDVMKTLADMGCFQLWIGSESGSNRILKAMGRGVTTDQIRWVVDQAKQVGIRTGLFLMLGYEGETIEDIEATIDHIKRSNPDIFFATTVYPIKGTPFFGDVEEKIIPPDNWAGSTDKDYRIRGRHSENYYRYARQWLHGEVEAYRLKASDPELSSKKKTEAEEAHNKVLSLSNEYEA